MKLLLLGVSRRAGKADQGKGNPYDIARLNSVTPMNSRVNEHNTFTAAGYRQVEIAVDENAVNEFMSLKYPAEYEVTTDSRPSANGLTTVVTGLAKAS